MMCRTFSRSTANWITDRQLRSVCTTTLAIFLWTNTSPGGRPMIWFAGTRESEQPIHRYSGACWSARREKYSGSAASLRATHASLLAKSWASELSDECVFGFMVRCRCGFWTDGPVRVMTGEAGRRASWRLSRDADGGFAVRGVAAGGTRSAPVAQANRMVWSYGKKSAIRPSADGPCDVAISRVRKDPHGAS